MFLFCIGTIRLACSLAVHYEKQQEQSEDKPHKGRCVYNRYRVFSRWAKLFDVKIHESSFFSMEIYLIALAFCVKL